MNLVHESARASTAAIETLMSTLASFVRLPLLFASPLQALPSEAEAAAFERHSLRGIICFAGLHYVAFFLHPAQGTWTLCDDAKLTMVCSSTPADSFSIPCQLYEWNGGAAAITEQGR